MKKANSNQDFDVIFHLGVSMSKITTALKKYGRIK
jgi:hypothetical protein